MSSYEWVIDTWVLARASDPQELLALEAIEFLLVVMRSHSITVDHQREIIKEYQPYIEPRKPTHVAHWWRAMNRTQRVNFRDGTVPQRHERFLRSLSPPFHDDDLKFVGVAFRGPDKFLVAEESDYTSEVKEYLSSEMGTTVFDLSGALETARL